MFPFNLLSLIPKKIKSQKPFSNQKYAGYLPEGPREIRDMVSKLDRCGNCHFVVFDNYWSHEVKKSEIKLCPTCGYKL